MNGTCFVEKTKSKVIKQEETEWNLDKKSEKNLRNEWDAFWSSTIYPYQFFIREIKKPYFIFCRDRSKMNVYYGKMTKNACDIALKPSFLHKFGSLYGNRKGGF